MLVLDEKHQEHKDPQGKMLEILKGIHESTFKGHVYKIEEGWLTRHDQL